MKCGHLTWIDAIALADLRRSDPHKLSASQWMKDGRQLGSELKCIPIAACDERAAAPALLTPDSRCEKVVRLIPGRLRILETAGRDEGREEVELLDEFVVELPARLVGRKGLTAVGGCPERVPADEDSSRPFLRVEAQKRVREPDNRAAALVTVSPDRLRQAVVGTVRERVPIDDQQWAGIPGHVERDSTLGTNHHARDVPYERLGRLRHSAVDVLVNPSRNASCSRQSIGNGFASVRRSR